MVKSFFGCWKLRTGGYVFGGLNIFKYLLSILIIANPEYFINLHDTILEHRAYDVLDVDVAGKLFESSKAENEILDIILFSFNFSNELRQTWNEVMNFGTVTREKFKNQTVFFLTFCGLIPSILLVAGIHRVKICHKYFCYFLECDFLYFFITRETLASCCLSSFCIPS